MTFENVNVTNNSSTKGGLRYHDVCIVGGQSIDLVVTASENYKAYKPKMNGKRGAFGRINMAAKIKRAHFTFSFYKNGFSTPVELQSVDFTSCDLDGASRRQERIVLKGHASYYLHVHSVAPQGQQERKRSIHSK